MRAIFYKKEVFLNQEELNLDEDSTHHLHVSRVKVGDEILVLNGGGYKILAEILRISKKECTLKVKNIEILERDHQLSLALGLPKKEAFEDIVKISVELGIVNLYPLSTKYSQYTFENNERIQRIIESAMIQSNNAFYPNIFPQMSLDDFLSKNDKTLYFLNSVKESSQTKSSKEKSSIFLIGPEAGFSLDEIEKLRNHQYVCEIHLPTPILRAPTAVATSAGYILSQFS